MAGLFCAELACADVTVNQAPNTSAKSPDNEVSLEEARAAFLEGMSLMKKEKWDEAAERFLVASSVRRTPGLLYYVAFCREQQQQYAAALELYQEAQDLVDKIAAADVEVLLPQAIARTDAALGHLSFTVSPGSAVLKVNGQASVISSVQRLDPGPHDLEITAPGYQPWHQTIELKSGERRTLEVALVVLAPPLALPTDTDSTTRGAPGTPPRAKPYVVGASALVALTGLGLGIYGTVRHTQASQRSDQLGKEVDEATSSSSSGCVEPDAGLVALCDDLSASVHSQKQAKAFMIAGYTTLGVGLMATLAVQFLWKAPQIDVAAGRDGGMIRLSGSF